MPLLYNTDLVSITAVRSQPVRTDSRTEARDQATPLEAFRLYRHRK